MINVYTYLGIVSRRGLFHTLFSAPPPAFTMRARLLGNREAFIHHWHNRQNWESEKAFQGCEGFDVE